MPESFRQQSPGHIFCGVPMWIKNVLKKLGKNNTKSATDYTQLLFTITRYRVVDTLNTCLKGNNIIGIVLNRAKNKLGENIMTGFMI